MYSDRNMTSRPLIVILGIQFFLLLFLDTVMDSRLYMYIVVRHIVKDVSHSSVCASLGGEHAVPTVLGQNGSGQNGTDKMVRTKWYGQNGTDKMVYGQNGIGQNGTDKMARTTWHG